MSEQHHQQGHWFVDRQVLLRAEGKVTYFTLSRPLQVALVGLGLLLLAYLAGSAAGLGVQSSELDERNHDISALRESQKILVRQVDAAQEEFLRIADNYERNQLQFQELLIKRDELEKRLDEKGVALAGLKKKKKQQRETLQNEIDLIKAGLEELELAIENSVIANKNSLRELDDLRQAVRDGTALAAASNEESGEEINLPQAISVGATDQSIKRYMRAAQLHVDAMRKERDSARAEILRLQKHLTDMEGKLGVIRDDQDGLIASLEERAGRQIASLEKTLESAGILPDHIYRKLSAAGSAEALGGPLQTLGIDIVENPTTLEEVTLRENRLDRELARWNDLHEIMTRLPLASPVLDNYYVSSGFGRRRDPMTRKWALHKGIDMAARKKTPVYATAPGKIVFAGYKGAYGRHVEIDHGLGMTTRYGHLHKVLVKRGQVIKFRDRIGLMGSTGRSTGSHLHYEVVYDGQPIDPAKFIEAGRHVFKN